MRVIIGGISHQTNTFSQEQPTIIEYQGKLIINVFQQTETAVGGFLAGANIHNFEPIPALYAEAPQGGALSRSVFDSLLQTFLTHIVDAELVDAILLSLHGGMVVDDLNTPDGLDDAEGYLLTKVREQVGADVPIIAHLAMHANVTPQMVAMADVLIGGETFPIIDNAARGRECVEILLEMLNEGMHPTMALHQMPLIWGINQVTDEAPMADALAYLHELETRRGVIKASLALGNPLADVPEMGASAYVITDNDFGLAQQYAKELGTYCHIRKLDWHDEAQASDEVKQLVQQSDWPLDLAEMEYKRPLRSLYPLSED